MMQKKVCMLGSFAVGKTSLTRRFVHSVFSDDYHTTIGVKIDRKNVEVLGQTVNLLIWDIHGEDGFQKVRASYLRGMSGFLLVADGTRPETLDSAVKLRDLAVDTVGSVPFILLLNKFDLQTQWRLRDEDMTKLVNSGWDIRTTSAKSGENVEASFQELTSKMLQP